MKLLAAILLLALPCFAEPAPTSSLRVYPAIVVDVHDGDTVKVDIDLGFDVFLRAVSIRLIGVYAPELSQTGGKESRIQLLSTLPLGSKVTLRPVLTIVGTQQMSFTRYIGRLWVGDTDACQSMVDFLNTHPEWGHGIGGGKSLQERDLRTQ